MPEASHERPNSKLRSPYLGSTDTNLQLKTIRRYLFRFHSHESSTEGPKSATTDTNLEQTEKTSVTMTCQDYDEFILVTFSSP